MFLLFCSQFHFCYDRNCSHCIYEVTHQIICTFSSFSESPQIIRFYCDTDYDGDDDDGWNHDYDGDDDDIDNIDVIHDKNDQKTHKYYDIW